MDIELNRTLSELFTVVFLAWLGVMGVIAFVIEKNGGRKE